MPTLYVANCTKKHLQFNYRNVSQIRGGEGFDPESSHTKNHSQIEIRSGEQVVLIEPGSRHDTESNRNFIVKQLGSIGAKELSSIKYASNFSGFIFSFDKNIKEHLIHEAHEKVMEKSLETSRKEVTKSALAIDSIMAKSNKGRRPKVSAVSIEERIDPNKEQSSKPYNFNIAVAEDGHDKLNLA